MLTLLFFHLHRHFRNIVCPPSLHLINHHMVLSLPQVGFCPHPSTKIALIQESNNLLAPNFSGYFLLHISLDFLAEFQMWLTALSFLKQFLPVPENFLPLFFILLSIWALGIYIIDFYKLYILQLLAFCLWQEAF